MEMKNLQKQEANMVQENVTQSINELKETFNGFKRKINDENEDEIRAAIRSWLSEQINSINDFETGKYLISLSEDGQKNDLSFGRENGRIQARIELKIARDITNTEKELNEFLGLKLISDAREIALKKLINLTGDCETLLSLANKYDQLDNAKIRDLALKRIINLKDVSSHDLKRASNIALKGSSIYEELIKKAEENKKPL